MDIEFNVKSNQKYLELLIDSSNMNYSTGLMDENEAIELAVELIYTAECLLPYKFVEIERALEIAREKLNGEA